MPKGQIVFQGKHFRVYHDQVDIGDGKKKTFEYVWRQDGTRVIALRSDDTVLLTREYRFELGDDDWRIPGGRLIDEHEEPAHAAAREFREETGFLANELEQLSTTIPFSTIDYKIHFFATRNPTLGETQPDEGERVAVHWLPVKEVLDMAYRGDIREDISALALIRLLREP